MRLITRSLFVSLSLLLLLAAGAYAQNSCAPAGTLSFPVTLTGTQFGGTGSANASGSGFVTLNPANNTATVQLNTVGLGTNITGASLMQNGTTVLPLTDVTAQSGQSGAFDQNGNFTRTLTLTPQLMNAILANPGAFNVGINTGEFPNGAISGTLMNGGTFGGSFSGTNVVGSTGAPNGGGSFSSNIVPNASGGGSTLFFTFTPSGIGNDFTGLSLNQGGVGATSTPFITLVSTGSLTNGRFTGSVPLTAEQAQQLMTNPNAFNVTANSPNGAIRAQFGMAQNELWFPVAGTVAGALGNLWTTDLRVYNTASAAPAHVTIELFPAGQNNFTSASTMNAFGATTLTVNARNTTAINNVTGSILSSFTGLGALRITSDQPIVAVERIYDANATTSNGANVAAAAQPILGRTMCDAFARGVLVGVSSNINGSQGITVRSNAGFFNPNPAPVTVLLNLANAQGGAIDTTQSLTLQPFQLVQMPVAGTTGNRLFTFGSDLSDAVMTYQASAPIFAYTTVVNNASGDTHLAFAQQDNSQPAIAQGDLAAIIVAAN